MPVLIPVIVAYAATTAAVAAGIVVAGSIGAALIGAAAGLVASAAVNAAFKPDDSGSGAGASPSPVQSDSPVTIRQAISPWQYIYGRTRVGGVLTFAARTADGRMHMVITLAGHVCQEIEEIWFNDEIVPLDGFGNATGTYAGYVRVQKSLGDEAGQPFDALIAETGGIWQDSDRQTGRTKIYVRLVPNADLFVGGIPNVTAVVKGKKVYDPRTGLTAWSANPSLCIADLLCDPVWLGCVYADEIDDAQLIAAANVDDEAVTLAEGGTEARYTLNGAFTVDTDPRSVIERMLSANAGKLHYLGGLFRILPAAYVAPTITLSEGDLRGVPQIQPRLSAVDLCNAVKGTYVAEDNDWQATDFPPVVNATYLAEDNGERSWRELELGFTKSAATAQRIAKIELERVRQQITVVWPGKFTCYRLQPGNTVQLNFTMLGWSAKVFEVMGVALVIEDDGNGGTRLGCDLTLRETASAVFDWNSGEETQVDLAPDTNLPNPFDVAVPGTPSVTEGLYQTSGSAGVKSRATISWTATDASVTAGGRYQVEYRLSTDAAYKIAALVESSITSVDVFDLAAGSYNFRIKAFNAIGASSSYSPVTTQYLFGLTAAPSNVANFAVQAYAGQAKFTWSKPSSNSDLDVVIGGRIYVRWSPLTAGATWDHGSLVNPDGYPGDTSIGFGPLMTGTYMAKAVDSSGNFSATEASFVLTEALLTGLTTLFTLTESPTFTGTKSNVAAVDGGIQLDSVTLVDSMLTLMDDWGAIDSLGGVQATGSYSFAAKMDLGAVKNSRLFTNLASLAYATDDLIDSRTNNIDDWGLFDGAVIEDAEAQLMVRITNDDPNAAPSWGGWHALGLVADYNARGFDFRLDFASGSTTHNRSVTTLAVSAKQ